MWFGLAWLPGVCEKLKWFHFSVLITLKKINIFYFRGKKLDGSPKHLIQVHVWGGNSKGGPTKLTTFEGDFDCRVCFDHPWTRPKNNDLLCNHTE